ncbi:MAG: LuxR C-terminal-related transcriptional regulator, partial [Solirubrobacterales bacterium]
MHVDPNSPRAELTKRQQEVLERLERGENVKQIATDIGVSRTAVYQHIERLRRQGALAETYTPSGQPPRRAELVGSV